VFHTVVYGAVPFEIANVALPVGAVQELGVDENVTVIGVEVLRYA
jgi:hypothetical protein